VAEEPGADPHVTVLLRDWQSGRAQALDELMPIVYGALRAIASKHLARERRDGTLATTALVHEAYVRLVDQRDVDWQNRAHFFAIAARVMRRIVIDEARRRKRGKRGSGAIPLQLDSVEEFSSGDEEPLAIGAWHLQRGFEQSFHLRPFVGTHHPSSERDGTAGAIIFTSRK